MANPASPLNSQGNQLDFLTDTSVNPGPARFKRGINPQTLPGSANLIADSAIGTHVQHEGVTGTNPNVVSIAGFYSGASGAVVTAFKVDADGNLAISGGGTGVVTANPPTSVTGTNTGVAGNASSTGILAAAARKGFAIFNNSSANLYILMATSTGVASTNNFTQRLAPLSGYEAPIGFTWQGPIKGIWDSATGVAMVTEWF